MRRAPSRFLSHLQRSRTGNNSVTQLSRGSASASHGFPSSPPEPHFKSSSKNPSFSVSNLNRTRFLATPSRSLSTLVDPVFQNAYQMSSRQKKIKQKSVLEEAFESAESLDEMLEAFEEMESCFDEKDLGLACLKIGLKLDQEGEDPQKALAFGQRALKVLDDGEVGNSDSSNRLSLSLPVAMTLQLLGSSCFKLKMFNESLGYLNRANRVLTKLELDNSSSADDVLPILHAVQLELFNVKTGVGRREDALLHLRKALEIKEKTLEEGSRELGKANRDVAEAYVAVLNFKVALSFGLKALEIHKMQLGQNSVEVAYDRKLLGVIYCGLEEHAKALEQNQLAQKVLKKWGCDSDLLRAEIDAANMQIALGKYEEAINTLKGVVQQTDQESEDRAMIFTSMGKALCNLDKFAECKRCLEIACGILDKKERTSPLVVAEAFTEISMQYEAMNEFETAISLLKRALSMLEKLPQEQHSTGSVSARIGWLLLLTGRVEQAIPYLEDAAERLKESFGSNHYGVGYVYNNLGAAYLELDRPQSACAGVWSCERNHGFRPWPSSYGLNRSMPESFKSLCSYGKVVLHEWRNGITSPFHFPFSSYPLALNFQEKVVEALEGHGPSAQEDLTEAVEVMEQLKKKVSAEVAETLMNALPVLPQEDDISADEDSPSGVSTMER